MDQSSKLQSIPIGSLTSKIAHSLSSGESQSQTNGRDSSTGTSRKQLSPQTGMQAGGRGALTISSSLQKELQGSDAWETDRALAASLPQPVARRLDSRVSYEPHFEVLGMTLKEGAPPEDLSQALAIVEGACQPSQGRAVVQELTKVMAVTKAREHDETDNELSLVTMADQLTEFPLDVVKDACKTYMRCEKWRPSLAEMRDYCWKKFRVRESLRSQLRRACLT